MKCSIPRCAKASEDLPPLLHTMSKRYDTAQRRAKRVGRFLPPELPLCRVHGARQRADFWYHCGKLKRALGPAQQRSWQATWIQVIDLELLHSGEGAQSQKGDWKMVDGVDVWVPAGSEAPRPSYPGYAVKKADPLPEHATRAGKAAIAKRIAEQELLERRLAAETADFNRGQRQVLELELKVKRETEARRRRAK